jgi:hypothetical protein
VDKAEGGGWEGVCRKGDARMRKDGEKKYWEKDGEKNWKRK